MKRFEWILIVAVVLFFVTGALFYAHLPAQVPSHWNMAGHVDRYTSQTLGAFLFPLIFLAIAALFFAIPHIDPKKENIARFQKYYDVLVLMVCIFFYYVFILTLLAGIGDQFNALTLLIPAFALLFYVLGIILPHTHPNWMVGIRTPWTISSPTVWKETHEVGGVLFKISGIVMLAGLIWPGAALWFILAPVVFSGIVLVVYSYVAYAREQRGG